MRPISASVGLAVGPERAYIYYSAASANSRKTMAKTRFLTRYSVDPAFRAKVQARASAYYENRKDDPDFKAKMAARSRAQYAKKKAARAADRERTRRAIEAKS